jgi:hypothetical protein
LDREVITIIAVIAIIRTTTSLCVFPQDATLMIPVESFMEFAMLLVVMQRGVAAAFCDAAFDYALFGDAAWRCYVFR